MRTENIKPLDANYCPHCGKKVSAAYIIAPKPPNIYLNKEALNYVENAHIELTSRSVREADDIGPMDLRAKHAKLYFHDPQEQQ